MHEKKQEEEQILINAYLSITMQVGTDNQNTLWHYSTHNKTKQQSAMSNTTK